MTLDPSSLVRLPEENAKEAARLLGMLKARLGEIRASAEKVRIRIIKKKILEKNTGV